MNNYTWTQIFYVVAAVVIVGCLLFGCSFNVEGLEMKVPDDAITAVSQGLTQIQKEDEGEDSPGFSEDSPLQNLKQAAMDLGKNVSTLVSPENLPSFGSSPGQNVPVPEAFSNYY